MSDFQLKEDITETVWCNMDQIADCTRPIRNIILCSVTCASSMIDEAHVAELRESFLTKELDYSCGIMKVAFARVM